MTTIAAVNQKGGVGKTTTTINLAYALVQQGMRVLMVDTDPQASLTKYAGYEPDELELAGTTLYHGLSGRKALRKFVLGADADTPHLLAASKNHRHDVGSIADQKGNNTLLRDELAKLKDDYDFVLIDSPPWLGKVTVLALTAAHAVLVPVEMDFLSLQGMQQFFETVDEIRAGDNPTLSTLGILPTKYRFYILSDRQTLEEVKTLAEGRDIPMLDPIPHSTLFDKAAPYGKPSVALSPTHRMVRPFHLLASRLVENYG